MELTSNYSNKHKFSLIEEAFASENVILASNLLNSVASAEVLDANYLGLYNVIKNMYQDSLVHSEDSIYIKQLAEGCPFTDGMVVYQARALYGSLYGYHKIFSDFCDKAQTNSEKSLPLVNDNYETLEELLVYPNPSEGSFIIYSKNEIKSIEIYDQVGKLITSSFVQNNPKTYTLSENLAIGFYTILINNINGKSYVKKIIVQRS